MLITIWFYSTEFDVTRPQMKALHNELSRNEHILVNNITLNILKVQESICQRDVDRRRRAGNVKLCPCIPKKLRTATVLVKKRLRLEDILQQESYCWRRAGSYLYPSLMKLCNEAKFGTQERPLFPQRVSKACAYLYWSCVLPPPW